MKTFLKIFGALVGIFIVMIGATIFSIFGGMQKPRSGPALGHGIEQVADNIATIFILKSGKGKVVLIDAGNDASGKPTLEALKHRGKGAADVAAIFITHAHPDHDASIDKFPGAEVYAMQDEVEIAEGREAYGSFISRIVGKYNPHPFHIAHPLHDGETVKVGSLSVTAYEVSGHTPGSAVYLAQGVLFTGDAFGFTKKQTVEGPVSLFSRDVLQAIQSLKALLPRLAPRMSEIEMIATSHSGTATAGQGFEELREFLARAP